MLEPANLLLLACALIYGLIGQPQEALILLLFVAAICLLDQLQQRRSRTAQAELARLSVPRARVRRHGLELELAAEQLQPGDQLRLEEGDRVAADARLLEAVGLCVDESLLTGESLPVLRQQRGEPLLAGSLVVSGRGWAEVTAVGEASELGRLGSGRLGRLGLLLALGLWLLLQALPGLLTLLGMVPLLGIWAAPLLFITAVLAVLVLHQP